MDKRALGNALNESFQQWKTKNPDWHTYLGNPASRRDSESTRQKRQKLYNELAALPLAALQRQLNARRLPPNPNRGHWEEFFASEALTISQHARGQHLPFNEQMEEFLAHSFEVIDSHFQYKVADNLVAAKEHIEDWFNTHVRQPAAQAWQAAGGRRQQK